MILEKKIKAKQIFFTDKKRFILNSPLNRQTNQIHMNKEREKKFNDGKGAFFEKVARPMLKFSNGIMVAGGLSYKGVGKLIFVTDTMRASSYLQTLNYFKQDIDRLGKQLYFQQDNSSCHVNKKCEKYIKENFQNSLDLWPADSPDLLPIEELWELLEEKLSKYKFNNLEELSKSLQWLWHRIPKHLCKNLISALDKKMKK